MCGVVVQQRLQSFYVVDLGRICTGHALATAVSRLLSGDYYSDPSFSKRNFARASVRQTASIINIVIDIF